ncbi:MAG: acyl-CoA dehydrogenase family protein [Thermoplasmata archaeon]
MTVELPALPSEPLAQEIAQIAERLHLATRYRELDRTPEFPRAEFRALGEARLLGLHVAPSLGGRGLPLPRVAAALFHLAYRGGTTFAKLSLQPEFSSIIAEHGARELVDRYFLPLVRGEVLIANQLTEPGAGADAGAMGMRFERSGRDYVLHGTKSEAAFAQDADAAIVYGRVGDESGLTALVVPQDLAGIHRSVIPDLGERWMRRGTIAYEAVRVPASMRIGEEGHAFEYVRSELTRERALLAAIYLGVARASWEETVRYADERNVFGGPLARNEAVSFPLVEDGAQAEAAYLYAVRALERFEAGERVDAEAALAKWMSTDIALRTIDHAIQFHGGRGYSETLAHGQRWRDVRSGPIAHGPSEVLHLVAARRIWKAPRERA